MQQRFALFTFGYFLATFWLLFLAFPLTLCNSNRGHFNSHFCFNFQRCFETFASARPGDNAGDGAGNSSSLSPSPAPSATASVIPLLLYPSSGFTLFLLLLLLLLFLALDKCLNGISIEFYFTIFNFNNFNFTLLYFCYFLLHFSAWFLCCLFVFINFLVNLISVLFFYYRRPLLAFCFLNVFQLAACRRQFQFCELYCCCCHFDGNLFSND